MRIAVRMVVCLLSISVSLANPDQGTSPREKLLLTKDISTYTGSDVVLTVRELEFPPLSQGEKHRHPDPLVVCVLEGSLEVALEETGPKTYSSGQCLAEEPHQLHLYSRNLSKAAPVRVISYLLGRSGEPLSRPEKYEIRPFN
jgi:quercetin dioxygenase-like cupin family protein